MKNKISKQELFAVSAKTIDECKPEVVSLMQRYGMSVSPNDSKEKIDMAFLSLLPRSRAFREDFAKLATPVAGKMITQYQNASGDSHMNFLDDILNIPSKGIGTPSSTVATPKPITFAASTAKTKKSFGNTAVGSFLSSTFDKDTTQNIINTGLGIYAYQKTGGTQGGNNPLNQARQEIQPTPPQGQAQSASTGLGTGGIVAISLGAIALVGFGIYFATKK